MSVIPLILVGQAIYAAMGVLFAAAFVAWGVGKVDPAARGVSLGFRLLILPGVAALWPYLLWLWLTASSRSARGPA